MSVLLPVSGPPNNVIEIHDEPTKAHFDRIMHAIEKSLIAMLDVAVDRFCKCGSISVSSSGRLLIVL